MENDTVPCNIPEQLIVTLTAEDIRALLKIEEYLFADEMKSYHAASPEDKEQHIFHAVARLSLLLQELLYDGPC